MFDCNHPAVSDAWHIYTVLIANPRSRCLSATTLQCNAWHHLPCMKEAKKLFKANCIVLMANHRSSCLSGTTLLPPWHARITYDFVTLIFGLDEQWTAKQLSTVLCVCFGINQGNYCSENPGMHWESWFLACMNVTFHEWDGKNILGWWQIWDPFLFTIASIFVGVVWM